MNTNEKWDKREREALQACIEKKDGIMKAIESGTRDGFQTWIFFDSEGEISWKRTCTETRMIFEDTLVSFMGSYSWEEIESALKRHIHNRYIGKRLNDLRYWGEEIPF